MWLECACLLRENVREAWYLGEERVKCERYTARVNTRQCRCAPKIFHLGGGGVAGWLTLRLYIYLIFDFKNCVIKAML
jgi:hypothetical protein